MLESLYIRNVGLIDEVELSFGAGLNVLTGETGAGKSMIIDALGLILGGKAGRDIVRDGQENATVVGVFSVVPALVPVLEEMGIEAEGELIVSRQVSAAGKSSARINGVAAPAASLRELGQHLVDIHGQHEHQSLLAQAKHITLLDKFSVADLGPLRERLFVEIGNYRGVAREVSDLTKGQDMERRLEMLRYQREELEEAGLYDGLEEEISGARNVLLNAMKIRELVENSLGLLYDGGETVLAALEQVSKAVPLLGELGRVDARAMKFAQQLDPIEIGLKEFCADLRDYFEELSPVELGNIDEVERRLDVLNGIKRKYGGSVAAAMAQLDEIRAELAGIASADARLEQLAQDKKRLLRDISALCAKMSQVRHRHAQAITSGVNAALEDMGMINAAFEVQLERRSDFGANGFDRVEFMIAPNAGEPRPLAKIASGGEMSRVMLALKSVLAGMDDIGTFIFDEIDTGVSGRTAQKVGEKMAKLARGRQILCITHLPQIAALADAHFLIEKHTDGEVTRTSVAVLGHDECVQELARLTGGAKITNATLEAAKEMKRLAKELKDQE